MKINTNDFHQLLNNDGMEDFLIQAKALGVILTLVVVIFGGEWLILNGGNAVGHYSSGIFRLHSYLS